MRVWRVSSHSTTSAAPSSSSTRNVTSSRFPIGVAQTASGTALRAGLERFPGDEARADQARRGAELGGDDPQEAAAGLERLARRELAHRLDQVLPGRGAEAAADDHELRDEDVHERPDRR